MGDIDHSPLGREVAYPRHYDASLLYPIPRALGRAAIGVGAPLPFIGVDRWNAYELSWLDPGGKPRVATATLRVPADSPHLVESKSLKLYLNAFNATRFADAEAVRARIEADLTQAAGAPVAMAFGLPPFEDAVDAESIDALDIAIDAYDAPDAARDLNALAVARLELAQEPGRRHGGSTSKRNMDAVWLAVAMSSPDSLHTCTAP